MPVTQNAIAIAIAIAIALPLFPKSQGRTTLHRIALHSRPSSKAVLNLMAYSFII
jgi:hypothetical protein